VTTQNAFREILTKADGLGATFKDILRWAIIEGVPEAGDHVLVSRYDEATSDLLGLLHELRSNAETAAHRLPQDYGATRRALIECQQRALLITRRFYWELYSPEAVESLHLLQSEGLQQWRSWTTGVKDALAQCRAPIEELNQALFQAWLELSERPELVAHPAVPCSSDRSAGPSRLAAQSQTSSK
jgi:hypothetical protein